MEQREIAVMAPATVANVAVGFDVLGFAVHAASDRIRVVRTEHRGEVVIGKITGLVPDLPREPERNTASVAVLALMADLNPAHGYSIDIHKGIPLGSGMGGSAASAVGAVVAANQLLEEPLPREELVRYAAAGEAAASGAPHADNVAPCVLGGMTAVVSTDPLRIEQIPVPVDLLCVLVHPHVRIDTRDAREALRSEVELKEHVRQSMRLSGFLAGCFRCDLELIGDSMRDLIVEPQRSKLIPGFDVAAAAARAAGCLGFAIAGSGPSVFAWVESEMVAREVESGITRAFAATGLESESWISRINTSGAEFLNVEER